MRTNSWRLARALTVAVRSGARSSCDIRLVNACYRPVGAANGPRYLGTLDHAAVAKSGGHSLSQRFQQRPALLIVQLRLLSGGDKPRPNQIMLRMASTPSKKAALSSPSSTSTESKLFGSRFSYSSISMWGEWRRSRYSTVAYRSER